MAIEVVSACCFRYRSIFGGAMPRSLSKRALCLAARKAVYAVLRLGRGTQTLVETLVWALAVKLAGAATLEEVKAFEESGTIPEWWTAEVVAAGWANLAADIVHPVATPPPAAAPTPNTPPPPFSVGVPFKRKASRGADLYYAENKHDVKEFARGLQRRAAFKDKSFTQCCRAALWRLWKVLPDTAKQDWCDRALAPSRRFKDHRGRWVKGPSKEASLPEDAALLSLLDEEPSQTPTRGRKRNLAIALLGKVSEAVAERRGAIDGRRLLAAAAKKCELTRQQLAKICGQRIPEHRMRALTRPSKLSGEATGDSAIDGSLMMR